MKRSLAALITLCAIAAAVWFGQRTGPTSAANAPTPIACVEQMFGAAARGDVEAYAQCFLGPERERVQRSLRQVSGEAAAASLKGTIADLKGWAVVDPPGDISAATCELTVERVYAGRIDRQRIELRREPTGWRIQRVDTADPIQPKIAYGTPVYAAEGGEEGK
jgi:hypothetical protein